MTAKRYSHDAIVIVDHLKEDLIYINGKDELLELAEYVDRLQEDIKQLKAQLKDCEKRVTDKEVEWLRNNTVWEQMPSNRRTFISTIYHRRNDE